MLKKLFAIMLSFMLVGCGGKSVKSNKKTLVASSFPAYDAMRAIVGDDKDFEVTLLLKPGSDSHSYEPTPKDIITVQNADLFVYTGGDSDTWVNDIISDMDKKNVVKLMDIVELHAEEEVEGMEEEKGEHDHHHEGETEEEHHEGETEEEHAAHSEEEEEYDEHVWTSLSNEKAIIRSLLKTILSIDSSKKEAFTKNANAYIKEINQLDTKIKSIVEKSKTKEVVFGDRFPLLYFVKEYGIDYHAAFKGCSEQSEPSAKTLSYLIDYVKKNNIKVVFAIELSNKQIANTIAGETGAKVETFYTMHNVSSTDFEKGETYITLMNKNINVLKEALL